MRTSASRRITWAPGWRLRLVLLATVFGSVLGLVFGLGSLNRPVLNAAVFYVLGAVVAAVVAGVLVLVVRGRRATAGGGRRGPARRRA